jgi:hypothetical protein
MEIGWNAIEWMVHDVFLALGHMDEALVLIITDVYENTKILPK